MLSDDLKNTIQEGYRSFLRYRNLKPRFGQRQMIATIASTLAEMPVDDGEAGDGEPGPICAVEAGTGTGKTMAYLLATLPIARASGKTLVVATGTVSLQSQLLEKDIPELVAATGWTYRFALAKGRGRYLCPLRLEQCLDTVSARGSGLFLFEDEIPFQVDPGSERMVKAMGEALEAGSWDGDRDAWPETVPEHNWRALTVDRKQCAGHRCRKFSRCCFFQARESLERADCIITNHDLVMADLALGGGAILPPPRDCIYVFDEAHRLGATTLRHFAGNFRLQAGIHWLEQLLAGIQGASRTFTSEAGFQPLLDGIGNAAETVLQTLRQSVPLFHSLLDRAAPALDHYRFTNGDIGEENRALCRQLLSVFTALGNSLANLSEQLEGALDNPHHPVPRVALEQLFQSVGNWSGRVETATVVWGLMAREDPPGEPPWARWLALEQGSGDDLVISVSPISAAETLREQLWNRCAAAVATSATLRALETFNRFSQLTGLPDRARCVAVQGAFDVGLSGVLAIPDIGADGGDHEAHTLALCRCLETLIDRQQGTLVLYSSRKQMERVATSVSEALRALVLMQGDYSYSEIIRRHRQRIDRGEGSIIFGLASFAEGLDLPGNYCNHVIVAKLPFAVPDDPLQSAQAEWLQSLGENPFKTMTLPDTSLRLIQACGRLLRTEQDSGRITILDRRLLTKHYGRLLLDSLPPYRRELGPVTGP